MKTISITPKILAKIKDAIKVSLEFEAMTGKQLNITSIVGEVLACHKRKLNLVVNDINKGFDAVDNNNLKFQIKTRRFKGNQTAMTGPWLDKNNKVTFDYGILVLLEEDYSLKEMLEVKASDIQKHFNRINSNRKSHKKKERQTMAISQFRAIYHRKTDPLA